MFTKSRFWKFVFGHFRCLSHFLQGGGAARTKREGRGGVRPSEGEVGRRPRKGRKRATRFCKTKVCKFQNIGFVVPISLVPLHALAGACGRIFKGQASPPQHVNPAPAGREPGGRNQATGGGTRPQTPTHMPPHEARVANFLRPVSLLPNARGSVFTFRKACGEPNTPSPCRPAHLAKQHGGSNSSTSRERIHRLSFQVQQEVVRRGVRFTSRHVASEQGLCSVCPGRL